MTTPSNIGPVTTRQNAEDGSYDLGADIDGQFVPFVTLDGPTVSGRVQAAQLAAEQAQQNPPQA